MIARWIDRVIETVAPGFALKRAKSRQVLRGFQGAEQSRLDGSRPPANRPADQEMMGPAGADALRAWGRQFARDNAYAWGVSDTIVSSVVGTGIKVQSCLETQDGEDVELVNEVRDNVWLSWCKVADINGQYSFEEIQQLAQKEIVEAGEVLIHMVAVPLLDRGIKRPVPLALELIEADRLATDKDTWQFRGNDGRRVVRGVELDEFDKPVAYWVHPHHPADNYISRSEPVRIPSDRILHLFRRDRVGQTRGVTWYAPAMQWMRDLKTYLDNEMQAGAVAACATAVVTTNGPMGGAFGAPSTASQTDSNGNRYSYLEPGAVFYLQPGENVSMVNPSRPNSGAEPWINLMLRGIAVGTGLSYEIVARDFSQTNYSSNRASQLEDRRRFRRWQRYMIEHLCEPVWREFCTAAAMVGRFGFPELSACLDDVDRYCPAEFQPPRWEWVDPTSEQQASESAINAFQSTYAAELGSKGDNWRYIFYQRAKENALLRKLGLTTPAQAEIASHVSDQSDSPAGTGEMSNVSTLQFKRNKKAIEAILGELSGGLTTEAKARAYLSSIGLGAKLIDTFIADALDGSGKLESLEANDAQG
jgi:lambda family phage portal protein